MIIQEEHQHGTDALAQGADEKCGTCAHMRYSTYQYYAYKKDCVIRDSVWFALAHSRLHRRCMFDIYLVWKIL